ncbi:MAG: efflux RND transporter periplasmic adaptor subunit [Verrucomicrobiota bacterium]
MTRNNVLVGLAVVLALGGAAGGVVYYRREKPLVVSTETIRRRDLEAVVSASGKIQPKRLVNISADTPGRVVNLAVNEGDRVSVGQFLLQIDPRSLRTRVDSSAASLQANQLLLDQMRQAVQSARVQVEQAQQTLKRQQDLWNKQLTPRDAYDKAVNDVKAAESALQERGRAAESQNSRIQQEQASLESARYDLSKVRILSPIDGIVTTRNIQEGETAVVGTMNNPGTVLLKLADMSIIQAEIEVDETSIPSVRFDQRARVTIDALPDRAFKGHVTEIGNSPIQTTTTSTATQATNFKVVIVLDEPVPDVRPGFTCTADITTGTRKDVVSVPIPAVAVRELVYDASGAIVKPPRSDTRRPVGQLAPTAELQPGQTRKETEGVFVLREGRAEFVPVKVGIAGDRYFEVLTGLSGGEQVITGPYNSVRGMADGDRVRVDPVSR